MLFVVAVVGLQDCYLSVTRPQTSFVAWHFIVFIELMSYIIHSIVLTKAFCFFCHFVSNTAQLLAHSFLSDA